MTYYYEDNHPYGIAWDHNMLTMAGNHIDNRFGELLSAVPGGNQKLHQNTVRGARWESENTSEYRMPFPNRKLADVRREIINTGLYELVPALVGGRE